MWLTFTHQGYLVMDKPKYLTLNTKWKALHLWFKSITSTEKGFTLYLLSLWPSLANWLYDIQRNLKFIHRTNNYIIGFLPNKSTKLTWLTEPTHNAGSKVRMKYNAHGLQTITIHLCGHVCCLSFFAAYIMCQRYKPCWVLGFAWTDCWGNPIM